MNQSQATNFELSQTPFEKLKNWLRTPLFLILFISILTIFHLLIVFCFYLVRSKWRTALRWMNLCIIANIRIVGGCPVQIENSLDTELLSEKCPTIFVSNHQSMYDIPLILIALNDTGQLTFIAKQELARWIPSVSFSLRAMGAALIDRSNPRQALRSIGRLGQSIASQSLPPINSVCIFPEGTRARDGRLKKFHPGGLKKLLEELPNAQIVPVAVSGSWKILYRNFLPVIGGHKIKITIAPPIKHQENQSVTEIMNSAREVIESKLEAPERRISD